MNPTMTCTGNQRGVALFVSLIFLLVLSVVAVIAMRGTIFEMRMVTNAARHEQAFETSELMRIVPLQVFDQHVFNRGWPSGAWGGTVLPADFPPDFTNQDGMRSMFGDALAAAGTPKLYTRPQADCTADPLPAACTPLWDQENWASTLTLQLCDAGSIPGCGANVAKISIVPDGVVLGAGAGGAQGAGYRGIGSGAATGGANMYFEIKSVGQAAANAQATTIGQYKQVIRN